MSGPLAGVTAGAYQLMKDEDLHSMQQQLMEELPTSKLDTRTLSLISTRDEVALMRMAKNLVRRLRNEAVPVTAAEQDANPSGVPGEPWRALCMRLKLLQSKAKDAMDRDRERDRYERTESRGEASGGCAARSVTSA